MAIPNPNPNIADGVKSDVTTYSSNKIDNIIEDITSADNVTVTVDSSIDSSLVNCNVRNGILVLDGRIASTAGVAISTAIFTIPGYNLTTDQEYCYFGLVETATPLNSYAYAENDGNDIKVYISTAIPAGGKIFFFNASMLVDKTE